MATTSEMWTKAVEQWRAWRLENPKHACTVIAVAAAIASFWVGCAAG